MDRSDIKGRSDGNPGSHKGDRKQVKEGEVGDRGNRDSRDRGGEAAA